MNQVLVLGAAEVTERVNAVVDKSDYLRSLIGEIAGRTFMYISGIAEPASLVMGNNLGLADGKVLLHDHSSSDGVF